MNRTQLTECKPNIPAEYTVEEEQDTIAPPTEPTQEISTVKRLPALSAEMSKVITTTITTVGVCIVAFLYLTRDRTVKFAWSKDPSNFALTFSRAAAHTA